ncbi:hypothetical protein RND81_08G121700 [Saponaria officinalis]|uniref:Uncharacterized protein n=1 Tax=Saponaria officinalis TaxID=3572 RepID=A0AAW1J788_SAPOF
MLTKGCLLTSRSDTVNSRRRQAQDWSRLNWNRTMIYPPSSSAEEGAAPCLLSKLTQLGKGTRGQQLGGLSLTKEERRTGTDKEAGLNAHCRLRELDRERPSNGLMEREDYMLKFNRIAYN